LGDTRDITMDFDMAEIARWRFPTTLCVSWNKVIFGVVGVGAAVSVLVTVVAERRRR